MVSMTLAHALPLPDETRDDRVIFYDVSWDRYVALRELLEGTARARVNYLEGVLEIMTLSDEHEAVKTMFGRLLETYALLAGVRLEGRGSMTFRSKAVKRGAEPDECYFLDKIGKVPDLVIEVKVTSGGIDKLALYRGLRVPEVWLCKRGALSVYLLGKHGYELAPASRALPDLDLQLLTRLVQMDSQTDAVQALKSSLGR